MKIRMAEENDLEFVKGLYKQLDILMSTYFGEIMGTGPMPEEPHTDEYWNNYIKGTDGFILIAEYENMPAAMSLVIKQDSKAHLEDLFVLPEYRHKGIAEGLVKRCKEISKEKGYKEICLNVLANNEKAHNLYLKENFKEVVRTMVCKL